MLSEANRELLARYPDVPIIDTSLRKKAKHCRRQHALMAHPPFGMGLRARQDRTPDALWFGTLIHEALDYVYSHALDGAYEYDAGPAQFEAMADEHRPFDDDRRELVELGLEMLVEYARWAPEHDDFEVVSTEQAALVPVVADRRVTVPPKRESGPSWWATIRPGEVIALYYVKFDGIVKDNRGRYWIMEHKTCERWWSDAMLNLDEQVTAYVWAAQQVYGVPIAGVMMNFLRKAAVEDPPLLKNGFPTTAFSRLGSTTADRYEVAVERIEHLAGVLAEVAMFETLEALRNREEADGHPTIRRELIDRSPFQVETQGRRIVRETLELLGKELSVELDAPESSFTCGGCPVRELCAEMEEGVDWQNTARVMYEVTEPHFMADLTEWTPSSSSPSS